MYWQSIVCFFAITITVGSFVDLFVKDWRADGLEKLFVRLGAGLAAVPVLGVVFNLLQIPLDYRIFLAVGALILVASLVKKRSSLAVKRQSISTTGARSWRNKSFWYALVVLVLFAVTLVMHLKGAFAYTYFEDTDPWGYAAVSDYIGENKTFSAPYYSIQYSEPYTQGYQIVMGVLSQTNDSVYWTMKFFTALIISFGVPFMYYFARRLSRDEEIALLAAIFLFAVPAWVSHFVFSLHFNMTIFVMMLYALAQMISAAQEQAKTPAASTEPATPCHERFGIDPSAHRWLWVGTIVYASLLVNHFSTAIHATLFILLLCVTRTLAEKRVDKETPIMVITGFALSLSFYVPAYARHWQLTETAQQLGGIRALFPIMRFMVTPPGLAAVIAGLFLLVLVWRTRGGWRPPIEGWLAIGNRGLVIWIFGLALAIIVLLLPFDISKTVGTGDRLYGLKDFFGASTNNLTNNPFGLGPVLMSTVLVAVALAMARLRSLFSPVNAWVAVSFAWLIGAFLLVLGKHFSIAIVPFRAWTFLGLFASLFAAWGGVTLFRMLSKNEWVVGGVVLLLAIVTVPTTFLPKWQVNTMVWQDHTIGVPESHQLFVWMRDGGIPKNSVVAHLCGNSQFLSGYDMNPPLWDETFHPARDVDEPYFAKFPVDLSAQAFSVLGNAGVEYVTLGASCLWQAPVPVEQEAAYGTYLRQQMDALQTDTRVTLVNSTGLELLLKLN